VHKYLYTNMLILENYFARISLSFLLRTILVA